ncbi:NAD(P)-dependent oxidoreductase [Glacieibacterium sp.]|uniref:NAD(P)-dependent oxidoreductase n=1 Tax=Glacieibacterium sp. TaxID=2860237 RepID=UPI003B0061EC
MTQAKFSVAHHFAPATGALLTGHPLVGEVSAIDQSRRWDLPTNVDIIFALHGQGEHTADHDVPPPPGWPGQVKFVQLASAGIDGYPAWLFDGPLVATAAGTSAQPISEFVLAAMLSHEKRIPAIYAVDGGEVPSQEAMIANPLGSLDGKTLGLIGIGQIGGRVATLARAFGMRVVAQRRSAAAAPEGIEIVPLDTLLARADHIVIAAPLTPETAGLLGADAFAKVRRGVHLVNIARGGIVDTAALIDALASGQVGAASLDVTDPEPLPPGHPLWSAPNVRITPHVAWSSAGTPARIFKLFAENVGRFAAGQPLHNQLER